MGLHNELPVYKASYDLLIEIFQFTKEFSKDYKYTVGESLKKEAIELLTLIWLIAPVRRGVSPQVPGMIFNMPNIILKLVNLVYERTETDCQAAFEWNSGCLFGRTG
jgi:hypothetical protein